MSFSKTHASNNSQESLHDIVQCLGLQYRIINNIDTELCIHASLDRSVMIMYKLRVFNTRVQVHK